MFGFATESDDDGTTWWPSLQQRRALRYHVSDSIDYHVSYRVGLTSNTGPLRDVDDGRACSSRDGIQGAPTRRSVS